MMSTFPKKYGITITNDNPDGSSAEENQAIVSLKGDSRAPDVVDVGVVVRRRGRSTRALRRSTSCPNYSTIPRAMKDTHGLWWGDYWGAISIGYNGNLISNPPKTWKDLLKPEYKGKVAMNGSPLTSDSAVVRRRSPRRSATAARSSNVGPGIDFFAKLKKSGNYIPVGTTPQTVASGQTPISIDWDYNNLAYTKEFPAAKWGVSIPSDGVYGGYYAQAINATAPHPWAARLWQEFMLLRPGSDHLPQGVHAPGAVQRPREAQEAAAEPAHARCRRRRSTRRRSSRASAQQTAAKAKIAHGLAGEGRVVGHSGRRSSTASRRLRPDVKSGRRRLQLAWLATLSRSSRTRSSSCSCRQARCWSARSGARRAATRSRTSGCSSITRTSMRIKTSIEVSAHHRAARRRSSASRSHTPRFATARRSWIRSTITTFSGVAANFGGIPLAFAFIATLGSIGVVTQLLRNQLGINIYQHGFTLFSTTGRRDRLPVLPAAADDPRDLAGDRRASSASGARPRRTSGRARGSSGATSASRC